jgi:fructose-bisphosphate aldolase class II
MVKRTAEIDLPRIAAIRDLVRRPLVLHGGSGVPHGVLSEAVRNGICKINVATEQNKQFHAALVKQLTDEPEQNNPRVFLATAQDAARESAREKMRLFGSAGKA